MPQHSPNLTSDIVSALGPPKMARPDVSEPETSHPPSQGLVTGNKLTARERDVLYGMARGQSNRDIATSLGIGLGTVKAHVKRLFLKLGVHDRVRAPLVAVGELERAARMPRARRGQRNRPAA